MTRACYLPCLASSGFLFITSPLNVTEVSAILRLFFFNLEGYHCIAELWEVSRISVLRNHFLQHADHKVSVLCMY